MDWHHNETIAFNTSAYYNVAMKTISANSSSTHSFQPKEVPDPNLKRMGIGSEVPWHVSRSGIEEAKGAQDTSMSWQQMESHTRPDGGDK